MGFRRAPLSCLVVYRFQSRTIVRLYPCFFHIEEWRLLTAERTLSTAQACCRTFVITSLLQHSFSEERTPAQCSPSFPTRHNESRRARLASIKFQRGCASCARQNMKIAPGWRFPACDPATHRAHEACGRRSANLVRRVFTLTRHGIAASSMACIHGKDAC